MIRTDNNRLTMCSLKFKNLLSSSVSSLYLEISNVLNEIFIEFYCISAFIVGVTIVVVKVT
jgi:hypothetical protein